VESVLLERLAAHRGVAAPVEELSATADEVGWRPADLLAIGGQPVPSELMPADPQAKPHVRRLLNRVGALTADDLAPIRRHARSLPAMPDPRGHALPPSAPMTFGVGLMRLMLVRNLDTEAVCRVVGWPMTLLNGLVRGAFPTQPGWLPCLADVLDLRPDDLAAIAGVAEPSDDDPPTGARSVVGGLVLDLLSLSGKQIDRIAQA
jgi:hypothetical protein